ncbi:hypothetical protein FD04_GL001127 [Secundilactobacillus odoratitofui DSM 19909 = JCM 15043]|uniref:Uncharacterized protein n=1 Tax=Secundilactobacillus odoratitofui DSM 19909 = JCM 15043 TaxID=1423776 RepID=A0A0R1LQL2_9LACO|nr:hypothetical protein FD04_GL001127 [Secundilactobacillus odoratitofui DSM 19909 = JCM 15043]
MVGLQVTIYLVVTSLTKLHGFVHFNLKVISLDLHNEFAYKYNVESPDSLKI